MRKIKFRFPKGVSGSVVQSENDHFGMSDGIFFFWKKKLIIVFLGWNLPEITVILKLFQYYVGITDKSRENRIFHSFFNVWPWSQNNYVMIPTTWQFPVNFMPKNYTHKLNFKKKKFPFLKGFSGSVSKSENNHFGMSDGFFFFVRKKVAHSVFRGEIYRRLP